MSIEEVVKQLAEELQKEVGEYVQFLLERGAKRKRGYVGFGWEGALKDLKDQYTQWSYSTRSPNGK